MNSEKLILGAADYTIFAATLVLSSLIGVYFQFTSKKASNDEYLLAGKDMPILPVAFSLMATFLSATTLMGIPAEMYLYGTNMVLMNIGFVIGPIISAYVFIPVFLNNDVSTAYEYLEKRFGKVIRRIMSAVFGVSSSLFTAASLLAPALALSAVTNLSMWMSIICVGVACTFYCTLGGMKAVLWADVFQAILMFVGLFVISIKGSIDLGGVSNVFQTANEGGRLFIPKFSFDLAAHYTFFSVLFQGLIITISSYGGGQMQIQRLLTLKNLKRSQIATFLSIPMVVSFQLLCCFSGLIFYAYFQSCDPLSSPNKPIYSADQLMPYFITSTMSEFPGLPGLCVSGIFSASLSTVSSALNSLAAITSRDFIAPFFPNISKSVFYTKLMSLFYGTLCIALSFLMASMGNLIRMTVLVIGMFAGPNVAVFILATCTTDANEEGVVLGVLTGIAVAAYFSFIPERRIDPPLPLSNECPDFYRNSNFTSNLLETTANTTLETTSLTTENSINEKKFHLAYMWISTIAMLTCLIVGYGASIFIGCFKTNRKEVPALYLSPIRAWFYQKNTEKKAVGVDAISGTVNEKSGSNEQDPRERVTSF